MICKQCGSELKTDVRFEPNKQQLLIWDLIVDNLKVDSSIPTLIHSKTFGWITEDDYKCELNKVWKENKESMFTTLGTIYEDCDGNILIDVTKKNLKYSLEVTKKSL